MGSLRRYFQRYKTQYGVFEPRGERMGWLIILKADKDIQENDIDDIVQNLPETMKTPFASFRQKWGWSCGVDINNPKDKKLGLSGSYGISRNIAESTAKHIAEELKKKGYIIELDYHW